MRGRAGGHQFRRGLGVLEGHWRARLVAPVGPSGCRTSTVRCQLPSPFSCLNIIHYERCHYATCVDKPKITLRAGNPGSAEAQIPKAIFIKASKRPDHEESPKSPLHSNISYHLAKKITNIPHNFMAAAAQWLQRVSPAQTHSSNNMRIYFLQVLFLVVAGSALHPGEGKCWDGIRCREELWPSPVGGWDGGPLLLLLLYLLLLQCFSTFLQGCQQVLPTCPHQYIHPDNELLLRPHPPLSFIFTTLPLSFSLSRSPAHFLPAFLYSWKNQNIREQALNLGAPCLLLFTQTVIEKVCFTGWCDTAGRVVIHTSCIPHSRHSFTSTFYLY